MFGDDPFDPKLSVESSTSLFPDFSQYAPHGIHWIPPIDFYETDSEVVVIAEVPGVKPEDISISFDKGKLTIKGVKSRVSSMRGLSYYCFERTFGSFVRTFPVVSPVHKSKIAATFDNGTLTIKLPKKKTERA